MITKAVSFSAAVALMASGFLVSASNAEAKGHGRRITVTATLPDPEAPRATVAVSDLNLASVEGEKTLNRRVDLAVSSVCGQSERSRFDEMNCRGFAWNGVRPQIANAVQRAHDIAATGTSAIAAAAITLAFPQ